MAEVSVSYKGNTILDMTGSATGRLLTKGMYCEANIIITYNRPATNNVSNSAEVSVLYNNNTILEMSNSGTKTLLTKGKVCKDSVIDIVYTNPNGYIQVNLVASAGVLTVSEGILTVFHQVTT